MRDVPKGVLKPTTNQFLPKTSVLYYWTFLYGMEILKATTQTISGAFLLPHLCHCHYIPLKQKNIMGEWSVFPPEREWYGAAIWYCSLRVRIPLQAWMFVAVRNRL